MNASRQAHDVAPQKKIKMQIRIIDKGAGQLAEALAEAPVSLALKGSILGELLSQRLLESGGECIFKPHMPTAIGTGDYVVGLELGRIGESFVAALRAFSKDII
jgi:hypothetical protein